MSRKINIKRLDPNGGNQLQEFLKTKEVFMKSYTTSYTAIAKNNEKARAAILKSGKDTGFKKALENFLKMVFEEELEVSKKQAFALRNNISKKSTSLPTQKQHKQEIEDQTVYYTAYDHNDHILGLLYVKVYNQEKEANIQQLAVDPDHFGQGIGKQLMDLFRVQFTSLEKIICGTRYWNEPVIAFYKNLGFTDDKTAKHELNYEEYTGLSLHVLDQKKT